MTRWLSLVLALLEGCAASSGERGVSRRYAQSLDSATSSCRQSPALCTAAAGEDAVVPLRIQAAAEGGASLGAALKALDEESTERLKEVMAECASLADMEVNLRLMGGQTPTAQQCREEVGRDESGQPITRAMQLGREKHRLALQCVQKRLSLERPGGFSLEQRYRYDPKTGRLELVSPAEEQALIQHKQAIHLRGTLVPDVVIHDGNPLKVELVFDFKFPCPASGNADWRIYPSGHPFAGRTQAWAYESAFQAQVFRVAPILGAFL